MPADDNSPPRPRRGRPPKPDALPKSMARREQRHRKLEDDRQAAQAEQDLRENAHVPPAVLAELLDRLDKAVGDAGDARECLGLWILPEDLVGHVLRQELGPDAGDQLLTRIRDAAAAERAAAGVEGPDVLPVEAVDSLLSLVRRIVAVLSGTGPLGSAGPAQPWWERGR